MLHAKPYIKAVAVLYPPASPSKLPPHLRTLQPEIFNPKTLHRPYKHSRVRRSELSRIPKGIPKSKHTQKNPIAVKRPRKTTTKTRSP